MFLHETARRESRDAGWPAGDPDAGMVTVGCPGMSQLKALPSPLRALLGALKGAVTDLQAQGHHLSPHVPAGPTRCHTYRDETHRNHPPT